MRNRLFSTLSIVVSFFIVSSFTLSSAEAAHFKISKDASYAEFFISKFGPDKLVGRLNDFSGAFVHWKEKSIANSYTFVIGFSRADKEGTEEVDGTVLENIFDADTFPEIRFTSKKYEGTYQRGRLEGVLALHGVKQPVIVDLKLEKKEVGANGKSNLTLSGETVVNLSRFGVKHDLGSAAEEMILRFLIKGVKQ